MTAYRVATPVTSADGPGVPKSESHHGRMPKRVGGERGMSEAFEIPAGVPLSDVCRLRE
jgi:hypothetical protein